jgi:hypothetical protein
VLGWVASIFVENFKIIEGPENDMELSRRDKVITIIIVSVTIISYFLANVL